jgi:hypothetical protein
MNTTTKQYWWVSHSNNFKEEVSKGYIWANNGSGHFGHTNLGKINIGDYIVSYANQQIRALGEVNEILPDVNAPDGHKPRRTKKGWLVKITWKQLFEPLKPSSILDKIEPHLPEKYSPLKHSGKGNQGYLFPINKEMFDVIAGKI